MRLLKRLLIALLALLGLLLACSGGSGSSPGLSSGPPSGRTYLATSVVILVIDGPRQSEMWGNRVNIPHLDAELAPLGTLLTGFRNQGPTNTNSGHAAISTGFYQEIENLNDDQLPSHAGIFQHFLLTSGLPREKAWVITSKDKLAILGDTTQSGWQGRYTPSLWCGVDGPGSGYTEDAVTVARVKTVLATYHPRLVLINLKEPDSAGHGGDWAAYLSALGASDACAAEIWNTLQADPTYAGKTAFFVTHDHGRHLTDFTSHGDGCEGCRQVALLALGPDFRTATTIPSGGELIDLTATAADILGFSLPGASGRILEEILK